MHTKKRYQDELNRYVLPKLGERTLVSIADTEVEEWVSQLREGTAPHFFEMERKQAQLEASAVKHIVRIVFGAIMRYSVAKGWIPKSPVTGAELPEPAERDVDAQILWPKELQALISAAEAISEQDGWAVRVLAFAGLRIGELFALQVRDLSGATLTVRATPTQSEKGIVVGPTKSGKPRNIALAPIAAKALGAQVQGQPADAFIFRSTQGGQLDVQNWRARVFSKAVAGAGLEVEGLTPHSLRHTAASMAISAGANILIVQRMLGL